MQTKKQPPKLFLLLFFMIGFYFFIVGCLPISVEINPVEKQVQGQIHRKSMIPPFKNIDISIPNLKQAVITTSRSSKGGTTYRVELEDFEGYLYPITAYYSSGYGSKARLQDTINNSIRNRYQYKYRTQQTFFIIFGFVFMFVPMLVFIASKKTNTNSYQQSRPNQYRRPIDRPRQFQRPQDFSMPHQTQYPESEEEKYKNINDSIIK